MPILYVNFLLHINQNNFDMSILVREVSRLIKSSMKATGPDKIHVVVLKNLNSKLSPKRFLSPVYKNAGDNIIPSVSLVLLENLLSLSSTRNLLITSAEITSRVTNYIFRSSRSTAYVSTIITHRISEKL